MASNTQLTTFLIIIVPVESHLMLAGMQESEALLFFSGALLRSERLLRTTASPLSNIR